MTRQIATPNLD